MQEQPKNRRLMVKQKTVKRVFPQMYRFGDKGKPFLAMSSITEKVMSF